MKQISKKELEKELLGLKKYKKKVLIATAPIPAVLAILAFFLKHDTTLTIAIASVGAILVMLPYLLFGFLEFQEISQAEDGFPPFLRDLSQGYNSGMTLPQAIATCAQTKYGILSKYVQQLNVWLSWGISFPDAWKKFTHLLQRSKTIERVNGIILEAFHSGGDVGITLNALASDVTLLKKIEADKKSMMRQHTIIMYIVFFIFLGIIVSLYKILLPILYIQKLGVFSGVSMKPAEELGMAYFKNLFFLMTLIQSICIGIISGQIAEEEMIAGIKHIIFMVAIGTFTFFTFIYPAHLTMDSTVFPSTPAMEQKVIIDGHVYYESKPAGGARVDIVSPQKETQTIFTNSLGEFSATITAPTQPGRYDIPITATHQGETVSTTQTIVVGAG